MSLATVASVVGIAAGANSLFGGGSSGGGGGGYSSNQGSGAPSFYVPTDLGGADQSWQQLMGQLTGQQTGLSNQINPIFLQSLMQQLGIDPSGLAGAGQQAGQQFGQAAGVNQQAGQQLMGQAGQDQARQQMLVQAGMDPNNALYNKERQQTIDSSRAADSARGIGMGGVSSGNEASALTNFQANWDTNQLGRMLSANQGANQTGQLIGADLSGAAGFAGAVPGLTQQAGAAPIAGQTAAAQLPSTAASQYGANMGQGMNSLEQILPMLIQYMNNGQGAIAGANNAFTANRGFQTQQSANGLQGLLTGMNNFSNSSGGQNVGNWLSNMWGGGGGSTNTYAPGSSLDSLGYGGGDYQMT